MIGTLLLVASPCLLAGALLACAWACSRPARCHVCGGPLAWRDGPARLCGACRHRWDLACYYGTQAAWQAAVGAAWRAGLRGAALRAAVDGALIVEAGRQRAA